MQSPHPAMRSNTFADPALCRPLIERLRHELDSPLRFMEVCGTHTVAIFRSGLRTLLPEGITHLSGPGCPVCVTHESEVAAFIDLANRENIVIATFGDLMRVPAGDGMNLKKASAQGARVEIVYSPLDALGLAGSNPGAEVVFLGVGFETTAPTVAATIQMAQQQDIRNFSVLSFHKLVPPALRFLLDESRGEESGGGIDAFLLPGHVSTILGTSAYDFIAEEYGKPGVIGGFDPADILSSLLAMIALQKAGTPMIVNEYKRAVADGGNSKARGILFDVFEEADARWRGLGQLPSSGLVIKKSYERFDALKKLDIHLPEVKAIPGCQCGEVLKGKLLPNECKLFGKACTPATPVGPCMVSTEGSCAAYFKYGSGI